MEKNQQIERHFTATGFVIHKNYTLLHWHKKVKAWLPPGGHINKNEDPVQAVTREIFEETGILVVVKGNDFNSKFSEPKRIFSPMAILIENINDPDNGNHEHIDLIYACKPKMEIIDIPTGWVWVSKDMLLNRSSLNLDLEKPFHPPDDVIELALEAFEIVNGS